MIIIMVYSAIIIIIDIIRTYLEDLAIRHNLLYGI